MGEGKSNARWPGANERSVVEEMIKDRYSHHWDKCRKFVVWRVSTKIQGQQRDLQEEMVQDIMWKVVNHLPGFKFQCSLRTWLNLVIDNYFIDRYRRWANQIHFASLNDPGDEIDDEDGVFAANATRSAESFSVIGEDLRTAVALLIEYAHLHSHPERDLLIIQMAILEDRSYREIGQVVGCHPPVVGHVVRGAQRYVREKLKPQS